MYIFYNPNPCGRFVNDCVIRAISKVENISWDEVYISLCVFGYLYCDWGNGNKAWSAFLKYRGYREYYLPANCPVCYTMKDFCREHRRGSFLLSTNSHAVACINGSYYDAWDSGNEIVERVFTKEW